MYRLICTIFFVLINLPIFSQNSQNVDSLGNWHDENLPIFSNLIYNDIWGYTNAKGEEYGIIGSLDYTHFVDLRTPSNPTEVTRIAGRSRSIWRDFKTYLHYGYGVADNGGASLQVFDLSDLPNSVTKVFDSQAFFTNCHNIFIDELNGRLYAVGTDVEDIVVLDIKTNPASPTLLKNVQVNLNSTAGYVHDIHVRNHIAYASHIYRSELRVYDLTDLDNVLTLGVFDEYTQPGLNHSSWVTEDGNTMVMADEDHGTVMKVVDVSDVSDMNEVSTFQSTLNGSGSIAHNPFIIGNDYVVVAYYHDGIQIYDISNPAAPFRVGYLDTEPDNSNYSGFIGSWGVYPYFPSKIIIASDILKGLFVVQSTTDLGYCRNDFFNANTFDSGETINVTAKKSIYLRPGFNVVNGTTFSAVIEDCPSPPPPCPIWISCGGDGNATDGSGKFSLDDHLKSVKDKDLFAYPNPINDNFNLLVQTINTLKPSDIRVVNNLGQEFTAKINYCGDNCFTVDSSDWPNGFYTVSINGKDGYEKLIKN